MGNILKNQLIAVNYIEFTKMNMHVYPFIISEKKEGMSLLVALFQNQSVNMLGDITKEGWKEILKIDVLLCPVCKNKVIPKCGTKKVWHFAHSQDSNCLPYHEAETEYHLLGKKKLYHWFQSFKEEPILEKYIRGIEQRPDIYLPLQNHAVEFQCVSMKKEIFCRRINGYKSLNMESDWIFAKKRLKKIHNELYSIQSGDLTAAKKDLNGNLYLYYFCPLQQKFLLVHNIIPLTSNKILGKVQSFSLKDLRGLNDVKKGSVDSKCLITQWMNQKKSWRKTAFKNISPASMYLKKVLYYHHKSLTLFSPLAGVPTRDFYHFDTAAFIWQSYLLYYIEKLPNTFLFSQIESEFSRLIFKRIFSTRSFPYLNENFKTALHGYLTFLEEEKVIVQIHENFYKKLDAISYPATLDEAFQLDKIFSLRGGFFDFV
ncbi:competence protein CoiA family protein [Bacillus sp. NEB1478]|uniref:competence protein CoiA n=1 Tax=Bacillus sp. NEB1478 TaxID=3073816 RepID=UPI002873AAE6|nr:competence protein CoiA family protein [Bacillus sp. NEB1478]WNB90599.1 competence protein CoiA family protein [Bacillus sp. NEB1478]